MNITEYHEGTDILRYKRVTYLNGYSSECTYDKQGYRLAYSNSEGFSYQCTYDEQGNELTYRDSNDRYRLRGKSVTKGEFHTFVCKTVNLRRV